jgi:glycine C-acetyltransferase
MTTTLDYRLAAELDALREAGTYKQFNTLCSPQGPLVEMEGRGEVLVSRRTTTSAWPTGPRWSRPGSRGCAATAPAPRRCASSAGPSSRTSSSSAGLADLVGTEAALTYVSCWNANEAAIPSLTDESTVILSDELNHASIIDAVRLARPARKAVFKHSNMDDLRVQLQSLEAGQRALVLTDGVFSMEGDLAKLPEIVELVREYDATLVVDDSHGTGVMGDTGRGVAEHHGLIGEIDVITSTLGKALGGAAGGFVAASEEVCDILAQRSRPQLFSNALPPTVACSALEAVRVLRREPELVTKLHESTAELRRRLRELGFAPLDGEAAIVPIIVGETAFAIRFSERLLDEGVFVTGFGFPVVPEGTARVRVQMSAAIEPEHVDRALAAFEQVGRELELI